jgi:hypothetical protein
MTTLTEAPPERTETPAIGPHTTLCIYQEEKNPPPDGEKTMGMKICDSHGDGRDHFHTIKNGELDCEFHAIETRPLYCAKLLIRKFNEYHGPTAPFLQAAAARVIEKAIQIATVTEKRAYMPVVKRAIQSRELLKEATEFLASNPTGIKYSEDEKKTIENITAWEKQFRDDCTERHQCDMLAYAYEVLLRTQEYFNDVACPLHICTSKFKENYELIDAIANDTYPKGDEK